MGEPPDYGAAFHEVRREASDCLPSKSVPLPKVAHHYTSTATLLKILESGCFWGTDYRYLNDPTEGRIARDLLREKVATATGDRDMDGQLLAEVNRVLDLEDEEGGWTDHFVVSFSAQSDLLGQWRAYGDDGRGVAIGVDLRGFPDGPLASEYWTNTYAVPLEYRKQVHDDAVNRLVAAHVKKLEQLLPVTERAVPSIIKQMVISWLVGQAELGVRFKHHGYAEEEEVRLLAVRHASDSVGSVEAIKVRTDATGMPVPYVEFRMDDNAPLPIRSIAAGPQLDRRAEHSLRIALDRHGYTGVKIVPSDKRYRK